MQFKELLKESIKSYLSILYFELFKYIFIFNEFCKFKQYIEKQ
jgi:hypothetical protein